MPKSDFEFVQIFLDLILFGIPRNWLSTLLDVPGEQSSTCIVDFLLSCPYRAGEASKLIKKRLSAVVSDSPLSTMWGAVTVNNKSYGEYRLPIFNGRPEFLQKIHTFVSPCCKRWEESSSPFWTLWRVSTLRYKQSKIANISSNSKSIQILSKRLEKSHLWKIRGKKSRWVVLFRSTGPVQHERTWVNNFLVKDPSKNGKNLGQFADNKAPVSMVAVQKAGKRSFLLDWPTVWKSKQETILILLPKKKQKHQK